ncbi:MAG: pyrophosphate--fructose-6-phosphate 1-phosphotransferase [Flavobacteriales bacterium]|nr:pyrophosphate--fructose-6-phosphate 1-phosphotransferase [Flavobacteriales bacterium]|tara:strand:+ start:29911 stop:31101 length:1191 start_codon:yes stop_codon:yes gene_type:complete
MKIAFLTSGGIAPCLSASIGRLTQNYLKDYPDAEIIGYLNGYKGLLLGKSIPFPKELAKNTDKFYQFGGSPIGNSRVKLTNIDDCIKKEYIKRGENPLEVAANQLVKDSVTILHTIGGDDTNTTAADLSNYLQKNNYNLTVVGLPKTIDNDVFPITQTLGAWTAAEQGAIFFENIVNENTTSDRQLIIHEIMGRHSGWLTAATTFEYRKRLHAINFIPEIGIIKEKWDVHSVFLPEEKINFKKECERLNKIMDQYDSVNVFLSEGAGMDIIINETEKAGETVLRDAFGHVRLDELNAGKWFAKKLGKALNANKILVQKSGYFGRSAKANKEDLELIFQMADHAVASAIAGNSGVIGWDENNNNILSCIDFNRIKGGKAFDITQDWYINMMNEIKNI